MLIAAQSSESWFLNSPKWPETHSATLLSRYQAKVCSYMVKISPIGPDATVLSQHSLWSMFLIINPFVHWSLFHYDTMTELHGDKWWLSPNSKSSLHLSSPTWTQSVPLLRVSPHILADLSHVFAKQRSKTSLSTYMASFPDSLFTPVPLCTTNRLSSNSGRTKIKIICLCEFKASVKWCMKSHYAVA
jgi:hypothetical protein